MAYTCQEEKNHTSSLSSGIIPLIVMQQQHFLPSSIENPIKWGCQYVWIDVHVRGLRFITSSEMADRGATFLSAIWWSSRRSLLAVNVLGAATGVAQALLSQTEIRVHVDGPEPLLLLNHFHQKVARRSSKCCLLIFSFKKVLRTRQQHFSRHSKLVDFR